MSQFPETELILTGEKRVYHINLRAEDIADDVIVVGDQHRVAQISSRFSKIDFKTEHREFVTHTGMYNGKRITVLSTGIGTDNIDIVMNELDAAVNINLEIVISPVASFAIFIVKSERKSSMLTPGNAIFNSPSISMASLLSL